MKFGSKLAAGVGFAAALGLAGPALAQTGSSSGGSGTPMQPGMSQSTPSMPSGNDRGMQSNSGSMRSGGGASTMNRSPSADTAQTDPSQLPKDQVMAVQQALSVKSDGVWGPQTTAALKKYQQHSGLPATGQLDEATRQKLNVSG